ncbi:PRELI-like family-domain-containing protein [Thamnocephalis sphaerospora]|uniref:PRELI-like family-domain-containing protein n=1 Tax=Thamnocephalis sphaerospora TaxID=78915 RepID=A0A4P9XWP9_9FUNG|nr:PRELI-like family-domain-containing protein [Thamnocephalis sphaerospora]|eukprot:RKP10823.1 PRELI-like family-domain-containing protein [Thamnocephalis sphaerospora]
MKIFSSTHLYSYNWNQVSAASWHKYPNPCSPHVLHVDILDRHVDAETGCLRTERLITCRQPIPGFFRRLLGAPEVTYAREVSEVDPVGRIHTATTWNLSMKDVMTVEELCDYRVDPENPDRTVFVQEARISALGMMSRLASRVEDFALHRFGENAAVGRRGFEWVLERLWKEGVAAMQLAHVSIVASSPPASA